MGRIEKESNDFNPELIHRKKAAGSKIAGFSYGFSFTDNRPLQRHYNVIDLPGNALSNVIQRMGTYVNLLSEGNCFFETQHKGLYLRAMNLR